MDLKVALLIVTVYFTIIGSQTLDQIVLRRKCDGVKGQIQQVVYESTGLVAPALIQCHSTTPAPCTTSPISLVTLYRLFCSSCDDHFYTTSFTEANDAVLKHKYSLELDKTPGKVATSANDCTCGTSFLPVYRLYGGSDHFYTLNKTEADNAVAMHGYKSESIGWYCTDVKNFCGATLPLFRFNRNPDHFYTTDRSEGTGLTEEGVTCYIWPKD